MMDKTPAPLGEWLLSSDRVVTGSGDVLAEGGVCLRRLTAGLRSPGLGLTGLGLTGLASG